MIMLQVSRTFSTLYWVHELDIFKNIFISGIYILPICIWEDWNQGSDSTLVSRTNAWRDVADKPSIAQLSFPLWDLVVLGISALTFILPVHPNTDLAASALTAVPQLLEPDAQSPYCIWNTWDWEDRKFNQEPGNRYWTTGSFLLPLIW